MATVDLLQLCRVAADGRAQLKALLDSHPGRSVRRLLSTRDSGLKLTPAQRATAEKYFELKTLNDRYGRRVWDEMGLTEVMRARSCSEPAVAGAKARLNEIASR